MNKIDKVKINVPAIKSVTIEFNKQDIEVKTYISMTDEMTLLKNYVQCYLDDNLQDALFVAEKSFELGIIDLYTNIDISEFNLDNAIASGLYSSIIDKIDNYGVLDRIRESAKLALEKKMNTVSMDANISKFLRNVNSVLEKASGMDVSKEGIQALVTELNRNIDKTKDLLSPASEAKKPVAQKRGRKKKVSSNE